MISGPGEGRLSGSDQPVSVNFPHSRPPRLQLQLRARLHQLVNSLQTRPAPSLRVCSSTPRKTIVISFTNVPTGLCSTRVKGWLGRLTTTAATTGRQNAATDQPTRLPSPPRDVNTSLEYSPVVRAALLPTQNVLMASQKRYIASLVWPMIIAFTLATGPTS